MIIQRSFVNEFPRHIHAWAHCDHYALSKGFINNGFDFFHPETYVYNKQFPNADGSSNESKITAVDFPINNYLVAALMKVFNSDSPAIFRLYTLIVACIGLVFLFLISLHFTKNWIISFLLPIIVVFTPVYLAYQVGFLPSITSLSLLFMSCYFFLKYVNSQKSNHLIYVILGLTFATLIRTPFVIHLIALLGYVFFDQIINRKFIIREWLIVLSGFVLPIIYFLYNAHLRTQYGSIFLSSPMIVEDWDQAEAIIEKARATWKNHYFNEFQYIILWVVSISLVAKLFLSKFHLSKEGRSLTLWFSIGAIGVLSYSFLMIPQFRDHDYYFLDTFYPIIFILLIYTLSSIKYNAFSKRLSSFGMLLLSIIIMSSSNSTVRGRRALHPKDLYSNQYNSYLDLDNLLSEHEIEKTEKLLIIDAYAPNMPFILSNMSGHALIYRSKQDIINAFDLDFDYIVVSKQYFFNTLMKDYPEFHQEVKLVGTSDKLLLFERYKNNLPFDIGNYLNLTKPFASFIPNFKNCKDLHADEKGISDLSGKEFGLTFRQDLAKQQSFYIAHITGEIKCSLDGSAVFISDINYQGENIFYAGTNLSPYIKDSNTFAKVDFYVFINGIKENSQGSFYIYNPNKEEILLKNLKIDLY